MSDASLVELFRNAAAIITAIGVAYTALKSKAAADSSDSAAKTGQENKATIDGLDKSLSRNNETTDEIHTFAARMSQVTQETRDETAALLRKVVAAARKEAMEESARHIAVLEGMVSSSKQQIDADRTRIVALETEVNKHRERIGETEGVVQKMSDSHTGLPKITDSMIDELLGKPAENPVPVKIVNSAEDPAIVRVETEKRDKP